MNHAKFNPLVYYEQDTYAAAAFCIVKSFASSFRIAFNRFVTLIIRYNKYMNHVKLAILYLIPVSANMHICVCLWRYDTFFGAVYVYRR